VLHCRPYAWKCDILATDLPAGTRIRLTSGLTMWCGRQSLVSGVTASRAILSNVEAWPLLYACGGHLLRPHAVRPSSGNVDRSNSYRTRHCERLPTASLRPRFALSSLFGSPSEDEQCPHSSPRNPAFQPPRRSKLPHPPSQAPPSQDLSDITFASPCTAGQRAQLLSLSRTVPATPGLVQSVCWPTHPSCPLRADAAEIARTKGR